MQSIKAIIIGIPAAHLFGIFDSVSVHRYDDVDVIVIGNQRVVANDEHLQALAAQIKLIEARKQLKEDLRELYKEFESIQYHEMAIEGDLPSCSYAEDICQGKVLSGFAVRQHIYRPRDNPP